MLKLLNLFILRSYLGPFLRSLGVSLFILVIQFISRYKGDIFGKGLETWVLVKIFAYASTSLMVLAFPVSVLLASLFTMGNFGEHYELAAMRSGGLSLQRILRPMIISTMVITLLSFGMSSYLVPLSNLKLYSLLYDIQKMKPAFTLQPGHFNSAVDNYVIRISDKDIFRDVLYDVMIYDHTSGLGNDRMIRADSGTLIMDPYGRYMHMSLYEGVSYEARYTQSKNLNAVYEEGMVRFYFDSLLYNFDLAGFALERTDESDFSTHQYMLNLAQLSNAVDSIELVRDTVYETFVTTLSPKLGLDTTVLNAKDRKLPDQMPEHIISRFPKRLFPGIMSQAIHRVKECQAISHGVVEQMDNLDNEVRLREIELHAKYSLPMACMVFLFVGAPLGAIIRKGGVGIPIIVSITLYLAFYVIMIQGKKMATEAVIPVWMGVWMPNIVMMPLAVYLTFESTSTAKLLSGEVALAIGLFVLRLLFFYLNPLWWLWQIPPLQRGIVYLLRPIARRFFPDQVRPAQRRMRVR